MGRAVPVALLVGWPVAWWGSRSLHTLSRRWLVFTPAGLVLHDQLVVVEAMLVVRRQLASIAPALADTTARDLTLDSPGLALEIRMTEPLAISPTPARRLRGEQPGVVSDGRRRRAGDPDPTRRRAHRGHPPAAAGRREVSGRGSSVRRGRERAGTARAPSASEPAQSATRGNVHGERGGTHRIDGLVVAVGAHAGGPACGSSGIDRADDRAAVHR